MLDSRQLGADLRRLVDDHAGDVLALAKSALAGTGEMRISGGPLADVLKETAEGRYRP